MLTIYEIKRNDYIDGKPYLLVELRGLSTDEKPKILENSIIENGSEFVEIDTGKKYLFDETIEKWESEGEEMKLQEKEITITTNTTTTVTPDENYDGLSSVTVITNVSGGGSTIDDYMTTTVDGNEDPYLYVNIPMLMKQIPHLDISNVQVFDNFFDNCQYITSIDLTGIDTTGVTSFYKMFRNCRRVTSLDVSGFDTTTVEDFHGMFSECRALTSLDLSNFDLSSAYNTSDMFSGCYAMETITLSNDFVGSNVNDCGGMFQECFSLTSLDLSMFAPLDLQNTANMFYDCHSLVDLDISGMDLTTVSDYSQMFLEMPDNAIVKVKDVANQQWVLGLTGGDDRPSAWTTSNVIVA